MRYTVASKGALARAAADLGSAKVGRVAAGAACSSSGAVRRVDGVDRVHIVTPLVGWVSVRCLAAAEASAAAPPPVGSEAEAAPVTRPPPPVPPPVPPPAR